MNLLGTLGVKICQAWEWAQIPGVVSTVVTSTPPMCVIRTPGVLWVEGGCCKAYRSGVYVCVCVCVLVRVCHIGVGWYIHWYVWSVHSMHSLRTMTFLKNALFIHTHSLQRDWLITHAYVCIHFHTMFSAGYAHKVFWRKSGAGGGRSRWAWGSLAPSQVQAQPAWEWD